jgi:hypothetical protein
MSRNQPSDATSAVIGKRTPNCPRVVLERKRDRP